MICQNVKRCNYEDPESEENGEKIEDTIDDMKMDDVNKDTEEKKHNSETMNTNEMNGIFMCEVDSSFDQDTTNDEDDVSDSNC